MKDAERKEVDELARFMWASWGGSDPDCSWQTLDEPYKFKWKSQAEMIINNGYTKRLQDNKLVPLDVKKLSVLLCAHRGGHPGFPTASWDNELAELI